MWKGKTILIRHGDCIQVMKEFKDNSIDSLVTDPPAGISFMDKEWDKKTGFIPTMTKVFNECLRVMKPGAHGFVWAFPRTSHWTATALEDAGFEIRDQICHLFGSGFPKSMDIEKQLRKNALLCECTLHETTQAKTNLSNLQNRIHTEESDNFVEGEVLQQQMSGGLEKHRPEDQQSHEIDSPPGTIGLDKRFDGFLPNEYGREKQSGMERRTIHRTSEGICDDSKTEPSKSEAERLCTGAYPSDGKEIGEISETQGSSPSHQSQYAGQSNRELETLLQSSKTLDGESYGRLHCGQCGKRKAETVKGIGNALKPSQEIWWLIRKPCSEKTVAANMLKWGCGGINIDASRISGSPWKSHDSTGLAKTKFFSEGETRVIHKEPHAQGRFPSNLILSHSENCGPECCYSPECIVNQLGTKSKYFYCAKPSKRERDEGCERVFTWENVDLNQGMEELNHLLKDISEDTLQLIEDKLWNTDLYGNSITEQFPKGLIYTIETVLKLTTELKTWNLSPNWPIREYILDAIRMIEVNGLSLAESVTFLSHLKQNTTREGEKMAFLLGVSLAVSSMLLKIKEKGRTGNIHSTVKPIKLMQYLINMITQPGGTVLDPFMGSGSTCVAAKKSGFMFIGIEKEKEYFEIAKARCQ